VSGIKKAINPNRQNQIYPPQRCFVVYYPSMIAREFT
jgi:hypothetical protein